MVFFAWLLNALQTRPAAGGISGAGLVTKAILPQVRLFRKQMSPLIAAAVGPQQIGPMGPKTCEAATRPGRPCAGHPRGWARRAHGKTSGGEKPLFRRALQRWAWMAGTSPAMTTGDRRQASDRGRPTAAAIGAQMSPSAGQSRLPRRLMPPPSGASRPLAPLPAPVLRPRSISCLFRPAARRSGGIHGQSL